MQEHSVKILNQSEKVLFVSTTDIMMHPDMIEEAKASGLQIISIPENLKEKIRGGLDLSGKPIIDISQFVTTYNDSFSFDFIAIENLNKNEKETFDLTNDILNLVGGKPGTVKEIKISATMRKDFFGQSETHGLWDSSTGTVIIHRPVLNSLSDYSGTLIHEAIHAKSGLGDISRNFESELTIAIGQVCEKALTKKKSWW